MSLDLSILGHAGEPHLHRYTWRDQALYALGIGAKRDELRFLYERTPGGMLVFPSYAVVPAYPAVLGVLERVQAPMRDILHGAQKLIVHGSLPAEGTLETVASLKAAHDLKRFAELSIQTQTRLAGALICETEWTILVRGAGGFGGTRPPAELGGPKVPRDRAPDWSVELQTHPEQALLYRLSGDTNLLHADPAVAAEVGFSAGPILHGLCTFGFLTRAVVDRLGGGDPGRLVELFAQFRRPVWPGDTLVVEGHQLGGAKVGLVVGVRGKPEPVVTKAWAEVRA